MMSKFDSAENLVTEILERDKEARSKPLEVIRQVFYTLAYKPKISRSRIDSCIDTILDFKRVGVDMETYLRALRDVQHKKRPDLDDPAKTAERAARAEEYRKHYSPKGDDLDDPEQMKLY